MLLPTGDIINDDLAGRLVNILWIANVILEKPITEIVWTILPNFFTVTPTDTNFDHWEVNKYTTTCVSHRDNDSTSFYN